MKNLDTKIDTNKLEETAHFLMQEGKGILAADESNGTADQRLLSEEIEASEENRRKYRELLLCTPNLNEFISGVILYDETFWQNDSSGKPFVVNLLENKIMPGIKVDMGTAEFPGSPDEKITTGLDTLKERLERYSKYEARFTKWRSVFLIDEDGNLPSEQLIQSNVIDLARYAKIVQEFNLVPIVEPEVLLNGKHSIEKSFEVTSKIITALMKELKDHDVYLPGVILKTSMVIQGDQNPTEATPEKIADLTVKMLENSCPKELGGVVFLSGGQTPVEATKHLDAIAEKEPLPWEIAFSYARALQEPALRAWKGKDENIDSARAEFLKRLELNQLADSGGYDLFLEYLD